MKKFSQEEMYDIASRENVINDFGPEDFGVERDSFLGVITDMAKVIMNNQRGERFVYDQVSTVGGSMYLHPWSVYAQLRDSPPRSMRTSAYRRLYAMLAHMFDAYCSTDFCHPGFHVFDHEYSGHAGEMHIDSFSRKHPIFNEIRSTHSHLSITTPIMIPEAGTGLNILGPGTNPNSEPTFKPYHVGRIYMHTGSMPHQISETVIEEHEYRMTLQTHLMVKNPHADSPYGNLMFF